MFLHMFSLKFCKIIQHSINWNNKQRIYLYFERGKKAHDKDLGKGVLSITFLFVIILEYVPVRFVDDFLIEPSWSIVTCIRRLPWVQKVAS